MRKTSIALQFALAGAAAIAVAQMNRTLDWISYGADAQRTGWAKGETRITRDNVKDFQLLWKLKLAGADSLMPPVIVGNLISYRGFKELAFVGAGADHLYVLNADLGKMFFDKDITYSSDIPKAHDGAWPCGAGMTAMAMLSRAPERAFPRAPQRGGARASQRGGARASKRGGARASTRGASPAAKRGGSSAPPASVYTGGFGAPRLVFVLGSDGRLHRMNTANGDEPYPPVHFLPANAKASALNMSGDTIYATTNQGCGGVPDAVWALDLSNESLPQVASYPSGDGGFWGLGGVAIGSGGTVYAQSSARLLALSPKSLQLQHAFTPPDLASAPSTSVGMNAVTPVVFPYHGRDLVIASGRDGRLYVLDAEAAYLSRTAPVSLSDPEANDRGIFGSLASWESDAGTRWVLASVWGPLSADLELKPENGPAPNGSIVAFKVEERDGKPALVPAWISHDLHSPVPPVIANGVVFGLSAGEYTREVKQSWNGHTLEERPKPGTHATLYAFDAGTGKELYSSGDSVSAPAVLTGLAAANGQAYFGTSDGTFYAFGLYMEH